MANRMYLTESEAKAKGLPSVQDQIDRYNQAIEIMRNTRPDSPMYQDCHAEVRKIRESESDLRCPHCDAPVAEEGCSNGLCEAVN